MRSQSIQEQDAKFREALRAVPIHNPRATVKVSPDYPDEVEITVPLVYKNPVARFLRDLLKASDVKQYKLDRIGTMIYRAIDGRKNFEQLIDEFATKEKITFFESRALLGAYFQTLTGNGIIAATMPKRR